MVLNSIIYFQKKSSFSKSDTSIYHFLPWNRQKLRDAGFKGKGEFCFGDKIKSDFSADLGDLWGILPRSCEILIFFHKGKVNFQRL